jgi:hypothetical protein
MATTEIEKLERRYADNPQGLTFAPLAEIYRKNGDTRRALELLQAGLELHPNYIPASIVLGRCHWDAGDLPAAEAAFSHVLRLDDENVIALKSLADINERQGRLADAQRWLNRLISIDRGNEEARQQLARLDEARLEPSQAAAIPQVNAAATAPGPEPVLEEPSSPPPAGPAETAPLDLTAAMVEPVSAAPAERESGGREPELEFLDTSAPSSKSVEPAATPEVKQDQSTPEPAPVAGLIVQEFVPPADTSYRSHPELTQEFASTGDSSDRLEVETVEGVELQSSGAAEFRVPNAAEELMAPLEPAPTPTPSPVPAAEPRRAPEVTSEPRRSSYSVRDTNGQSVADYFQSMLARRPTGGPTGGDAAGARSQANASTTAPNPATTIGGEESAQSAAPAPSSGPPADAVSFDDFFGAPAGGTSSLPKGRPDPGEDDLDQFQSWLQNLKR